MNDAPWSPTVMLDVNIGIEEVPRNVTHVRFSSSTVFCVLDTAFQGRAQLREVRLNDGLEEIGNYAFSDCTALRSINMPSTVRKIGYNAFYGCGSLTKVVLNEGLTEIGYNAFTNCKSLQSIAIPSSVLEIGNDTFLGCTELGEVILSDGLKKIGSKVFHSCTSLQSIEWPSTVTDVSLDVFHGCTNLRDVVLREGVEIIWPRAFRDCTSLERITIPTTVTDIGGDAFKDCTNLREIVFARHKGFCVSIRAYSGCTSLERFKFPGISLRLTNIIQAGQTDINAKMDAIAAVWRGGELSIPTIHRQKENRWGFIENLVNNDNDKLKRVLRLVAYYELKESTTLMELALWKVKLDQTDISNPANREACRIEVPGPVKDNILQYLR